MQWKRTRVTLNVWQDTDFKITENPEADNDERFRLDVFGADGEIPEPQFFAGLEAAKRAAATLNELALLKMDNERLRMELDNRRQADAFGRNTPASVNSPAAEPVEVMDRNGRGVPAITGPVLAAASTEDYPF